jgi:hypothetical protein
MGMSFFEIFSAATLEEEEIAAISLLPRNHLGISGSIFAGGEKSMVSFASQCARKVGVVQRAINEKVEACRQEFEMMRLGMQSGVEEVAVKVAVDKEAADKRVVEEVAMKVAIDN